MDEYRKSLGVLNAWILTPAVEEAVYHEAKTKGIGLTNAYALFDALVRGLADAKLFAVVL